MKDVVLGCIQMYGYICGYHFRVERYSCDIAEVPHNK